MFNVHIPKESLLPSNLWIIESLFFFNSDNLVIIGPILIETNDIKGSLKFYRRTVWFTPQAPKICLHFFVLRKCQRTSSTCHKANCKYKKYN